MLYHLLFPLRDVYSVFNVFQYITFRTIYATITALLLSLIFGPYLIRKLSLFNIGQRIRKDGPPNHRRKEGTPTMGGLLIIIAVVIPTLLWANLKNPYIWLMILILLSFGAVGFVDDYMKLTREKGLRPLQKFLAQTFFATVVALFLMFSDFETDVAVPFFKDVRIDMGWFYLPFAIFIIVGTSNAVNLTDGLDGLAIGPVTVTSATYMLFAYLAGHSKFAAYLQIPYVSGSGELAIFAGAMVGASLGFLWYNTYPAQIFMGDIGSLALGGAIGTLAIITKQEFLLAIVGGIFVVETLSVVFQVGSYRLRGKRIFRMAPLHHHFELKGWSEPKITVRFWIISLILSLVAISTLKLR